MIINLSERATNNLYLVKVELVYAKTSERKSITIIGLSFVFFYVSIHFIQLSLQTCHWGTALKKKHSFDDSTLFYFSVKHNHNSLFRLLL